MGGKAVPGEDTAATLIPVVNPATGAELGTFRPAGPADIDAAVEAAAAGRRLWAATTPAERGKVLTTAAGLLRARNDELALIDTRDTGRPIQETTVVDVTSAADCLDYFGGLGASLELAEDVPLPDGTMSAYTRREPLGICAGIGAWNYPLQIAAWKAAPALLCGNAMIFKPSELTPRSALLLADVLAEAGLPDGVFSVVLGAGATGAALIDHPDIAKVSLTGSVPTGSAVMAAAAATLKVVSLELGGKSPIIVCEDADLDDAVSGAILGNFYSSGQICSNGTRVFVHESVVEPFLDRLRERASRIVAGDPEDPATELGPLISQAQFAKVTDYIATGVGEGARLVCGGDVITDGVPAGGRYVAPTVFADCTDDMTIVREEIFGPVMSVLTFAADDEAVTRANATPFGLSAGVFSADLDRARGLVARLEAGTCWINTYNVTPVEVPFGGVKRSGFGRENGRAAIDHYTYVKSVIVETAPLESPY
ncbi:MAG: betaine-aldehyde dehydrogenase [Actinomycetota bacterium]|nr:betaine-aldehyde dehydrogenase [Actinomycetota bacterium]